MIQMNNSRITGWQEAIRGMRNPMNSWSKSDSEIKYDALDPYKVIYTIGANDHDLMMKLRNAGTDHRKFMRMITVYVDITAPLYWWKEFDTYKVGTVANSCSTMHKIHDKEFTINDFSTEHLLSYNTNPLCTFEDSNNVTHDPCDVMCDVIKMLNTCRTWYLKTGDKKYWWQMIQLLPSSYNQKRTVMLNYEVLANIYKSRKDHKLDEWIDFCKWIDNLPYSEFITGKFNN